MKIKWIDSKSRETQEIVFDLDTMLQPVNRDAEVFRKIENQVAPEAIIRLNTRASNRDESHN